MTPISVFICDICGLLPFQDEHQAVGKPKQAQPDQLGLNPGGNESQQLASGKQIQAIE
jgi:hypothetical protein